MPSDIVVPNHNENELIKMACRLGYTCLYLVYDCKKIPHAFKSDENIVIRLAAFADPSCVPKARKYANLVVCEFAEDNRLVVEKNRPDAILGFESQPKRDFMHSRNSGMNHVIADLMSKNNVSMAVSFRSIAHPNLLRQEVIGRISQNIRLCEKFNVNIIFASFAQDQYQMRSPHDLLALARYLGMSGSVAKSSINY